MKKVIKHRINLKNDSKSAEKAQVAALLHSWLLPSTLFYTCFSPFQSLEVAVCPDVLLIKM